jgi:hypothetical protein
MDLIKFERQVIIPSGALEEDMLIFNLCNDTPKDLTKENERNLISFLSVFKEVELEVNTKNWTYIVNSYTGIPKKLKTFERGNLRFKANQQQKTHIWDTFEILNYLQIAYEKKYEFRKLGHPLRDQMKYFRWVSYNDGFAMVTRNYESISLEIAFSLLD